MRRVTVFLKKLSKYTQRIICIKIYNVLSGNTAKFRGYLLVITKIVLILSMFFFVEQYLCYFEFLTMYSLVSKFYFSQHRMGYEKDLLSSWIS